MSLNILKPEISGFVLIIQVNRLCQRSVPGVGAGLSPFWCPSV